MVQVRKDPDITIQRVARAIERVFLSDGRIDGSKIYSRRDLKRISEAMARKSADPARYVNQGYHNTSLSQCIMRQELEVNPGVIMEMVASLVISGKAFVGAGRQGRLVKVDSRSMALDLEARLANDANVQDKGIRDAAGQLFDLLVNQAFWDMKSDEQFYFAYLQDQKAKPGSTGERLVKLESKSRRFFQQVYEGPQITVEEAFDVARMFDDTGYSLIVHDSLVHGLDVFSVANAAELGRAVRHYMKLTGKPPILLVFAGLLPDAPHRGSRGHDLHAVTAYCCGEEDLFFVETRWGPGHDLKLLGVSAEEMILAMSLPKVDASQPYDHLPGHQRVIDPAYPISRVDRAPQFAEMQLENTRLEEIEKRALSNPIIKEQEKYMEELEQWEAKRAEHFAVFGDALPFNLPPPTPPSTSSLF